MMVTGIEMMASHEDPLDITQVDIHDVLSNQRRQLTLKILKEDGGSMTGRELSERIAGIESGEDPPPRDIRQSVYVSLHQTHLPKLDDLDIVTYDESGKTVELNDRAEQVAEFMTAPGEEIDGVFYLTMSSIGLGFIVASEIGMPFVTLVPTTLGSSLVLLSIAAVTAYRRFIG